MFCDRGVELDDIGDGQESRDEPGGTERRNRLRVSFAQTANQQNYREKNPGNREVFHPDGVAPARVTERSLGLFDGPFPLKIRGPDEQPTVIAERAQHDDETHGYRWST